MNENNKINKNVLIIVIAIVVIMLIAAGSILIIFTSSSKSENTTEDTLEEFLFDDDEDETTQSQTAASKIERTTSEPSTAATTKAVTTTNAPDKLYRPASSKYCNRHDMYTDGSSEGQDYVKMRFGPDKTKYDVVMKIDNYTEVEVETVSINGWTLCHYEGSEGWIRTDFLRKDLPKDDSVNYEDYYYENDNNSNDDNNSGDNSSSDDTLYMPDDIVYCSPLGAVTYTSKIDLAYAPMLLSPDMENGKAITKLYNGKDIKVVSEEYNGWYLCEYGGKKGWIKSEYVVIENADDDGNNTGADDVYVKSDYDELEEGYEAEVDGSPNGKDYATLKHSPNGEVSIRIDNGSKVDVYSSEEDGYVYCTYGKYHGWIEADLLQRID